MVVAGYTAGLVLLAAVLRRGMLVGVVYGIWAACGVLFTVAGAAVLFGDRLTWLTGLGLVVLVAGVVVVELGPSPSPLAGRRAAAGTEVAR